MGSGKLRGQILRGLALSREVQWTPGRGMRLVGKDKELTRRQDKPEREERGRQRGEAQEKMAKPLLNQSQR